MEARIWRDSTVYDPLSSDVQRQFVCYTFPIFGRYGALKSCNFEILIDPDSDGILSDAFLIVFQYYICTLNYNCPKFFDRLGLPTFSGHYGLGVIDGYLKFRPIADPVLNQIGMDQFEQDDPIDIDR
jgi:hypothetical protein